MNTSKIPFAHIGVSISLSCAVISGGVFVQRNLAAQSAEDGRQTSLQIAAKEAKAESYVRLQSQPLLTVDSPVSLPDGLSGKLPYSLVFLDDTKQWGIVAYQNDVPTVVKVFSDREIKAAQSNLNNKNKEG